MTCNGLPICTHHVSPACARLHTTQGHTGDSSHYDLRGLHPFTRGKNMQDSKIDVGDDLGSDDAQRLQLPWSIKRVILWLVVLSIICYGVGVLSAHFNFNHVTGWSLTAQDVAYIVQISIFPVILAFLAFLRWQCKKEGLSLKSIWGAIYSATQVRYIIFAFVFGAIVSLLWNLLIVNFGKPSPQYSSSMIFYGWVIVIVLLTPLQEELYFRGLLYRILRKQNDSVISNLISALIFAAFHVWSIDLTGLFFIFFSGMVTAFLLERTNSLTASFVYHAIGNLVSVVVFQYREFF